MQQVLFRIPITFWSPDGIPIYGFGVMLFLAFVVCLVLGTRWGKREGVEPEIIQDLALWLFLGGLIGARITFIIFHLKPKSIGDFLVMLPRIWDGGIILYGSIIGGMLGFTLYHFISLRKKNIPMLKMVDLVAPLLAIGLCLGRLGCFCNGCCYGQVAEENCPSVNFPMSAAAREGLVMKGYQTHAGFLMQQSSLPIIEQVAQGSPAAASGLLRGDRITKVNGREIKSQIDVYDALLGQWPRGQKDLHLEVSRDGKPIVIPTFQPRTIGLHPTQLYEAISAFLICLMLVAFRPLRRAPGQVTALLMMSYAVHRYFNEILRVDERPEGFEKYVSVMVFVGGCLWMVWLSFFAKPEKVPTEV